MKMRNLLVAVSLAGFAPTAAAAMDAISATDQKIANKSVIAASVSASKAGYLVVHEADATGTKPGKIIGNVAVKVGENKDVTVPLMSDVKTGCVRGRADLEDGDQLVLRAVEAAHAGVALDPHAQILERELRRAACHE
jgi:hypothetical protein